MLSGGVFCHWVFLGIPVARPAERGVFMDRVPITSAGYEKLNEELLRLKTEERPTVIRAIAEAREHGDLSENAEYHAARERQGFIEGRIAQLEDMLARVEVIDISKLSGNKVMFGATVKLVDVDTDEKKTYTIVGDVESDHTVGRISLSTPVARALIGRSRGDTVEIKTAKGVTEYEILEVKFA